MSCKTAELSLQICGQLCGSCYMFIMTSIFGVETTNFIFIKYDWKKRATTEEDEKKLQRWNEKTERTSYEMHANFSSIEIFNRRLLHCT